MTEGPQSDHPFQLESIEILTDKSRLSKKTLMPQG